MAMIISASIDLAKIDRSRIVVGRNGAEYYNISINVNDEADQYGNNASIITNQTKEERDVKAPKTYLGNGKTVWSSQGTTPPTQQAAKKVSVPVQTDDLDQLPF